MLELLQQLLANNRKIAVNTDSVINNIEDSNETLTVSDQVDSNINYTNNPETLTISDATSTTQATPPYYWASASG